MRRRLEKFAWRANGWSLSFNRATLAGDQGQSSGPPAEWKHLGLKAVTSGSVSSGPVAQAPRADESHSKPRDSNVRDYHNEALNRSDQMAAPP